MKTKRDLIYRNNVYEYRTELGISQDKMAKDLEISRRSISKIENGEQNASLEMVYTRPKFLTYSFVGLHSPCFFCSTRPNFTSSPSTLQAV